VKRFGLKDEGRVAPASEAILRCSLPILRKA
jgi:hypothetical protein